MSYARGSVFKNRVVNGDFTVWQRGTSRELSSGEFGYFTADRFRHYNLGSGGSYRVEKGNMNGFCSLKVTVTAPSTDLDKCDGTWRCWAPIWTIIEAGSVADIFLKRKLSTLSFLFRSNVKGLFTVALRWNQGSAGNIVWGIDTYIMTFDYSEPDKVVRVVKTIPMPDTWNGGFLKPNSAGFDVVIGSILGCRPDGYPYYTDTTEEWISGDYISYTDATNWANSSDNYIEVACLQFEEGPLSEFEIVPTELQYLRCLRYYEKGVLSFGDSSSVSERRFCVSFIPKRTVPTLRFLPSLKVWDGSSWVDPSTSPVSEITETGFTLVVKTGSSWNFVGSPDGVLEWEADADF